MRSLGTGNFSEDGVRSVHRTGTLVPIWRLDALVFRPDLVRISHQVGCSAEWQRIAVWAVGYKTFNQLVAGRTSAGKISNPNRSIGLSRRPVASLLPAPSGACQKPFAWIKNPKEERRGKGKMCLGPLSFPSNIEKDKNRPPPLNSSTLDNPHSSAVAGNRGDTAFG
jgi:hypothetical protein